MTRTEALAWVWLASSRPDGNTAALARAAFPADRGRLVDIGARRIGYYSYTYAHAGDDFLGLVEEAIAHRVWVIATPLYWYTMSAQAKTLLDRFSDLLEERKDLGHRLRGIRLAILCAGADADAPENFAQPFELTAQYLGMPFLGCHYAQLGEDAPMTAEKHAAAQRFGTGAWLAAQQ
jgi:multimeric flavodoxin WrbA